MLKLYKPTLLKLTRTSALSGLLACALTACSGADAPQSAADETVEVMLKDVPADVKNVVMSMSPDFEMVEVLKKRREGRTYFDVEGELPNGNEIEFDILITDDGPKIVEIQRDIRWKTVPKAAKKIVRKANADKAKIVRVIESKQAEADMIIYEIFVEGHPSTPRFEVSVTDGGSPVLLDTPWKH